MRVERKMPWSPVTAVWLSLFLPLCLFFLLASDSLSSLILPKLASKMAQTRGLHLSRPLFCSSKPRLCNSMAALARRMIELESYGSVTAQRGYAFAACKPFTSKNMLPVNRQIKKAPQAKELLYPSHLSSHQLDTSS